MPAFGAATNLVSNTITLTIPTYSRYWYIQNQDIAPLKVTFTGGEFGPIVLNAATATGAAGDWIDSVGFPFFGTSVTLTSTIATAQFGSGATRGASRIIYIR